MKPLQEEENIFVSFFLKFMRIFGVEGREFCKVGSKQRIPLTILSWQRAGGSTKATPSQG